MNRRTILLALLASSAVPALLESAQTLTTSRELIVCGREKVFIVDLNSPDTNGTPKTIWTWQAAERSDLPKEVHSLFRSTDECKPVDGGRSILITSSTGGVALVDRAKNATVFYGRAANAHSADLLPNGRIAVASSRDPKGNKGDSLILFDRTKSDQELWRGPLPSGHGVVWDEQRQRVWALNDREITCYELSNWTTPNPSLTRTGAFALPESGGHDLFAIPGTPYLSVSTADHCWVFDRDAKKISRHPELADHAAVKSMNRHPVTGETAFTQGERPEWWTTRVQFLNPTGSVSIAGEQFYKVRWNAFGK